MIEQKMSSLGIKLPNAPAAVGSYVPVVIANGLAYVSGQIPVEAGQVKFKGKVGKDISIELAQEAARLCTINALAQLKSVLGRLENIEKFVRVTGFVNCEASFTDHAKVVNGASDLVVQIFGENGKHARAAVGVISLPLNSCVEVEFLVQLKQPNS